MSIKHFVTGILILSIGTQFPMHQAPVQGRTQKASANIWKKVREGDLKGLKDTIAQFPETINKREIIPDPQNHSKTIEGLPPLGWAVLAHNKSISPQTHLDIVELLIKSGAQVNFHDQNKQTILHMAMRGGDTTIIEYLLKKGAAKDLNVKTIGKGRTPLEELLRASKHAIIHLSLENKDIYDKASLQKELPGALDELAKKESTKLNTPRIEQIINLLKKYGNLLYAPDETGRMPDFYINNVQLISEIERLSLLNALDAPITPRKITYDAENLPMAQTLISGLLAKVPFDTVKAKVHKVMWTIQEAINAKDPVRKANILRVAMALLSNLKDTVKQEAPPQNFPGLEYILDAARTVLRDAILILQGKATKSVTPAGRSRLNTITNKSAQKVSYILHEDNEKRTNHVYPKEMFILSSMPSSVQFTQPNATLQFGAQGITLQAESIDIVIDEDNTLNIRVK